jgi:hypothetical protein
MVPQAKTGDYVLVHVGADISVVDEEETARVSLPERYRRGRRTGTGQFLKTNCIYNEP